MILLFFGNGAVSIRIETKSGLTNFNPRTLRVKDFASAL
jgi:hypothetical protein